MCLSISVIENDKYIRFIIQQLHRQNQIDLIDLIYRV